MNKSKKIAMSVVSIVMAGALLVPLAACDPDNGGGGGDFKTRPTSVPETRFNASSSDTKTITVGGQQLTVLKSKDNKLAYPSGTQINVDIIDSANEDRKISYASGQIATYWQALDGYTYAEGDLKPAWWQLGQDLGIKFKDVALKGAKNDGTEIERAIEEGISKFNLINASVTKISANKDKFLNLANYLEYMPNFKQFLKEYEIVEWSLNMDENGAMYYIPYFDGNDDIEKYEMVQRDWVKAILDDDLPTGDEDKSVSYLAQYKAKVNSEATSVTTSVVPFMETTGSWSVETTKADGSGVGTLVVSYNDVITALQDSSSLLNQAIVAAGVSAPQTTSGNIIDIQNQIINSNNGVKGTALAKVLREYIKVAYKLDGAAYTKLSDVFLSASAGWDADLMTALFRCVVTNFNNIKGLESAVAGEIYALAGREAKPQRENDFIALAGELYGVRGLESRLDYLYVDSNGDLKDARLEEASYEAAAKLYNLTKEGLLYTGVNTTDVGVTKVYASDKATTFMLHDYVQTQTKDGFTNENFDFAPIVTPVSKWDDGSGEKHMRFTESWRSVKNSGVVIPTESVAGKPDVLSAVLTFVDYLFSNDGQIIGSYGPMSTNGNVEKANGFWYGNEGVDVIERDAEGNALVDDATGYLKVKAAYNDKVMTVDGYQYFLKPEERGNGFMYGNVLYKGLQYKDDKQIPIMTTNNTNFYLGKTVNGNKMGATTIGYKKNHMGNYTDYARGIVGAALPIGNKDQGFEFQCTAKCGLDGAKIVGVAIDNGTIKHVQQTIDKNNWWYTVVPSVLPVTDEAQSAINSGSAFLEGDSSTAAIYNSTGGTTVTNVYIDLAFYGYNTNIAIGSCGDTEYQDTIKLRANASELIQAIRNIGVTTLSPKGYLDFKVESFQAAWNLLKRVKQGS